MVMVCCLCNGTGQAASEGDLETVMSCLAYRCSLEWRDPKANGATALHCASAHGQVRLRVVCYSVVPRL